MSQSDMPWTIHIDRDVNCAFFKFYGAFDIRELRHSSEAMLNHPDYRVGMNTLRDAREQPIPTDVSFKSLATEARGIMSKVDPRLVNIRMAIVAADVQSYAKLHQYIVAGRLGDSPVERKAFRDIGKAKEWLGVPRGYEIKYSATGEIA